MYLVPSLKQKCMEFVRSACNDMKGAIQCYDIGILCEDECPEVLEFFIKEYVQKYLGMGDHYVSAEVVERIAKNCPCTAELTEDKLFVKIFHWGKVECTRLQVPADKNGIKNILSPIIKYMKLENVSFDTWLYIIEPYGLAPPEECIKIFKDYAKSCPHTALQLTPKCWKMVQLQ